MLEIGCGTVSSGCTEIAVVGSLGLALATFALALRVIRLLFGRTYDGCGARFFGSRPGRSYRSSSVRWPASRSSPSVASRLSSSANAVAGRRRARRGVGAHSSLGGKGAAGAGVSPRRRCARSFTLLARTRRGRPCRGSGFVWRPLVALAAGIVPLLLGLGPVVAGAALRLGVRARGTRRFEQSPTRCRGTRPPEPGSGDRGRDRPRVVVLRGHSREPVGARRLGARCPTVRRHGRGDRVESVTT